MSETWLPVVGFETLYRVSTLGRVRALGRWVREGNRRRYIQARYLKPSATGGYLHVTLVDWKGDRHYRTIHSLVAAAFLGPCPEGMEILHGPGGALDNRASVLSYGTKEQNAADKRRDGTHIEGEAVYTAKLTDGIVMEILATPEISGVEWARRLGIRKQTISDIRTGRTWKHIERGGG